MPGSSKELLEEELKRIEPVPSFITFRYYFIFIYDLFFLIPHRASLHKDSNWTEHGLAVYYSFNDLRLKGWLSSDKMRPWKRTESVILDLARNLKMTYIYVWYPHQFGEVNELKPNYHKVIIQDVLPTRTGIDRIKSSVAVWLSAVNGTEPTIPLQIFKRMWTPDDHWTHYPFPSETIPRDEY